MTSYKMLLSKPTEQFQNFVEIVSFFTWLYRIATNTAKNHLVAKARKHTNPDIDVYEESASNEYTHLQEYENPENLLESRELELLIKETVQNLEPELRSAITLREHAGLSYEQIAQIMECPVGTVRSRIFRARASVFGEDSRPGKEELTRNIR